MAGLLGCRRGWFFFLVGHRRDHHLADDFFSSPSWCDNLQVTTGVEIPKFVDKTTPEYKPKFDAVMVELKEAEQKSLKESERLEKEIADVQDLKVIQ
ncbi:hypothetical protein LXL04_028808 [Taraxacum kok-saghyz]